VLLLRGLLAKELVDPLRRLVERELQAMEWMDAEGRALVPTPGYDDRAFVALQQRVVGHRCFDRLRRCSALLARIEEVLGCAPEVYRGDLVRFMGAQGKPTPPHQDHHFTKSETAWTVWAPLGPCSPEQGGLALWFGSHGRGPRPHLTERDGDIRVDDQLAVWSVGFIRER
jgi:hypothetical protein